MKTDPNPKNPKKQASTPGSFMRQTGPTPKRGHGGSGGSGDFNTVSAPTVGGQAKPAVSPNLIGSSKKNTTRKNVSRIKRSKASPQAKKSAIRLMRGG